jgi:hypothetical protein
MHISLERLVSTVALLGLVLTITPQMLQSSTAASQQTQNQLLGLSMILQYAWIIDLIAISVSVDNVALTLSMILFLCIFPIALLVSVANPEAFVRILVTGFLTFGFVVARYIANLI